MKANTIEQFYIFKWIDENFHRETLEVTLIDRCNVKIKDGNGDEATVTYVSKDNIVLH
ncbi:hypothetical protein J2Z76_000485 [Sedimentibacter acidaminivorans]|uniref:Uncharacterized protein n=1 Tax=Sedimentibacter acidaminivorans TaxID=913099 RepID=A0ABS4GAD0_9FIRM|nr:hypothetical protein [Sedimentibacter acidaminivorans]MBP1924632.1 hypothetical protein [Sedimentibacter acidaminivorans]